jgi:phage-related protein
MKKLRFLGSNLDDLKSFPFDSRREAGYDLDAVQRDSMPSDFKPLFTVGPGAYEIRIHKEGEWRVEYVLHEFQKKTQNTRREDIELAARRYNRVVNSNG